MFPFSQHNAAILPESPVHSLFRTLMGITCDRADGLSVQLVDLYLSDSGNIESLIVFARQNELPFDCPLCGGCGIRQVWEDINDVARGLRDEPCCCQAED